MCSVVDGPVLSFFGVGRFSGVAEDIPLALSVANVAGWIPGISIIVGIARCVFGFTAIVFDPTSQEARSFGQVLIVRGLAEICCVGFLAAPIDFVTTVVRLVRDLHSF